MENSYKDGLPILLSSPRSKLPDESMEVELVKRLDARSTTRSSSMSLPYYSSEASYEGGSRPVYHTGPLLGRGTPPISKKNAENLFPPSLQKMGGNPAAVAAKEFSSVHVSADHGYEGENFTARNEHLLRSGPLGRCNDPYCTTCPYYPQPSPRKKSYTVSSFDTKFHNTTYGGAVKGWIRKPFSFLGSCVPGIMNPHAKAVQRWNKFFVISCLVAIFIDPLFFFLLSVQEVEKCIVLNWSLATTIAVVRSVTDFIYFLHILLQFRLAYVAPESRVVGAGDLVDLPKKIAFHYLRGSFFLDLFVVLPLPQIMILLLLPTYVGSSAANYAKNLLRATVLLQYIPRTIRFVPLLIGQSATGFIFESAWANFVINLLIFILAGHVVGSCWYLFGLQRVNQCLRKACSHSTINNCKEFVDCGRGNYMENFLKRPDWKSWLTNSQAAKCFDPDNNKYYGIYTQAVVISTKQSIVTRYVYSIFWGFQQISTLAGNQTPSAFVWEVVFTMAIIGLGLLLFALLIGNMQNFLLALGRRGLEMQLRRRDVEQWMSHRRLPEELRRLVRQSERFNWAATQGVNEDMLLDKLPEDLQRKIRRHLFKFVKKVRIFTLLDESIIDAICEKLRQKLYIKGSKILYKDGPIDTMVFIVRGNMESVGGDGNISPLKEGDVCGEELLLWCLEQSSGNKERRKVIRISGHRLLSNRTVRCLTNVDAFALRVADLEEVTAFFARYLRNPRVQGVIRYASPYWRTMAATRIQVAWRYRKKRLNRSKEPDHQQSTQWSRLTVKAFLRGAN